MDFIRISCVECYWISKGERKCSKGSFPVKWSKPESFLKMLSTSGHRHQNRKTSLSRKEMAQCKVGEKQFNVGNFAKPGNSFRKELEENLIIFITNIFT